MRDDNLLDHAAKGVMIDRIRREQCSLFIQGLKISSF